MNPANEIDRLLSESGAVLVRQNKHPVYKLPNGRTFVIAKTPSDARSARNGLSELRRALAIAGEESRRNHAGKDRTDMVAEQTLPPNVPAAAEIQQQPPPIKQTFRERLEAAVATLDGHAERLMSEVQQIERQAQMLKALLPFADDAAAEDALTAILPTLAHLPPSTPAASFAEAPERITERVQVTRQLVFAATQTFEGPFTVNDVYELMVGDRRVDRPERQRIRSSIAASMMTLHERGELNRETLGKGRQEGLWRKAEMKAGASG